MRIKVACINWGHADAPHAVSYVHDPILGARGEAFHPTWEEAMDRAVVLAGMLPAHRVISRKNGKSTKFRPLERVLDDVPCHADVLLRLVR